MSAAATTTNTCPDSTAVMSNRSAGEDIGTTVGDMILWRNPKLSSLVFATATFTWALFNIYHFSFVTVASWITMAVVTSLYLYANFVRLLRKEEPDLSGLRSAVEKKAAEVEKSFREWSVLAMQCFLSASTNQDWKVFSMILIGLGLLSYVGTFLDFLTLFYLGVVMMLTLPVMYKKNKEKALEVGQKVQMKAITLAYKFDEQVVRRLKGKVVTMAAVDGEADKEQKDERKRDELKTE